MKDEYDFSTAERGRFFRKGAALSLPIYLEADLQSRVEAAAEKAGKNLEEMVDLLLRRELGLVPGST